MLSCYSCLYLGCFALVFQVCREQLCKAVVHLQARHGGFFGGWFALGLIIPDQLFVRELGRRSGGRGEHGGHAAAVYEQDGRALWGRVVNNGSPLRRSWTIYKLPKSPGSSGRLAFERCARWKGCGGKCSSAMLKIRGGDGTSYLVPRMGREGTLRTPSSCHAQDAIVIADESREQEADASERIRSIHWLTLVVKS
jgi:hypothetical protein